MKVYIPNIKVPSSATVNNQQQTNKSPHQANPLKNREKCKRNKAFETNQSLAFLY